MKKVIRKFWGIALIVIMMAVLAFGISGTLNLGNTQSLLQPAINQQSFASTVTDAVTPVFYNTGPVANTLVPEMGFIQNPAQLTGNQLSNLVTYQLAAQTSTSATDQAAVYYTMTVVGALGLIAVAVYTYRKRIVGFVTETRHPLKILTNTGIIGAVISLVIVAALIVICTLTLPLTTTAAAVGLIMIIAMSYIYQQQNVRFTTGTVANPLKLLTNTNIVAAIALFKKRLSAGATRVFLFTGRHSSDKPFSAEYNNFAAGIALYSGSTA
jgi:hypothetical protein